MTDKHTGCNHMSIDDIEDDFREHEEKQHQFDRRKLIVQGAKLLGGMALGTYLLTRSTSTLADVNWQNKETTNSEASKTKTSSKPVSSTKGKSRIIQITNSKAVGSTGSGKTGQVNDLLKRGMMEFTGERDFGSAWKNFVKPGNKVGIKVNCIAGPGMSTQVATVMAIVEGLKSAGVREDDIIIWERSDRELTRAGFTINKSGGLKCYGTPGYESKTNDINGTKFKLSNILIDQIDVLINAPVMKNHGGAGVTLAMKNHYGSHNNPGDHHGNKCDPHIGNICLHPAIKDKTKLIVVDALRAQCNGGPSNKPAHQWTPGMFIIGTDPVAVDITGSNVIDARRKETGLGELGNSIRHINTASELGLGNMSHGKIDLKKIVVN